MGDRQQRSRAQPESDPMTRVPQERSPKVAPEVTARKKRASKAAPSAVPETREAPVNRSTRARLRTRKKLIDAARRIMGSRGVDGATIAEITEEADVGFGTFYNHFESKEEISRAVLAACMDELATTVTAIGAAEQDVALAISYIQRAIVEKARKDPVWGWFLIHSEGSLRLDQTFHSQATRDLQRGLDQGRFKFCGIDTAITMTMASLMAVMRSILEGYAKPSAANELVEFTLRMYGVPNEEAARLANHPMPKFDV